ncbi:MAG: RHS repeat-associated core domain-containing protein [Phycisphaerae bacterium]
MEAEYHYYDNDLLEHVEYANFTSTWYGYDAARRLTSIEHRRMLDTILRLEYTYTDNDLVATITEYDNAGWVATVTFAYDNRGRLIGEVRTGENPYDLTYTYDQGGNRLTKVNTLNPFESIEVVYHYDIEDPETYDSDNNRLVYYETCERSGTPFFMRGMGGGGGECTPVSTTWYYYNSDGNVTEVFTVKENPEPGEPQSSLTRLEYAINGQTVTYVLGETWGNGQDYDVTYARQFRYDGARQRYLNRQLDPETLEPVPGGDVWSDYDGDEIYGDYIIDGQTATNLRSFEPGLAKVDPWTNTGSVNTSYYHGNQIGTTRFMTDSGGTGVSPVVYTAFGEIIAGESDRYGYAGSWGYQTDEAGLFPFLHVGHRYYDPTTGRFLQRDPLGIFARLNVYLYVGASPFSAVDPKGLYPWGSKWDVEKCQGYCQKKGRKGKKGSKTSAAACGFRFKTCLEKCSEAEFDVGKSDDVPQPPDWDPWEDDPTDDFAPPSPSPPSGGGCGCTGLEAVPVLWVLWILRTREDRRRRCYDGRSRPGRVRASRK